MHKYKVKVYVGTAWSFITQADHYDEYTFASDEPIAKFAKRLAREGFEIRAGEWIMPGAILEIRKVRS
jgi:hypothetical protein